MGKEEYRVMEGDRKAYTEESQYIIRRQRAQIETLQGENEELMKEDRLAGSQGNQAKDDKNIVHLSGLLSLEDEMREETSTVKANISKLDVEIAEMERKIKAQRKNMGGVHMSKDKHVAVQK